ncbi:unnamed protein product [Ilex paraguariensis]|uniref:Uncharacterized protein n=1 Tax=Ilex paraguariensis TaxID=185542 RepID=A0ABC8TA72_9AQUA
MAGICCYAGPSPILQARKINGFRCYSRAPNNVKKEKPTPQLLKIAVSGVTELLRLFSSSSKNRKSTSFWRRGCMNSGATSIQICPSQFTTNFAK